MSKMHFSTVCGVAATIGLGIGCASLSGCDKPASKPAPEKQSTPAPEGSKSSGASPVDWSAVAASRDGSQIVALKSLAARLDDLYHGATPSITITMSSTGASDDHGNKYEIDAARWKGIMEDIKAQNGTTKAQAPAGSADRHVYTVTSDAADSISFRTEN